MMTLNCNECGDCLFEMRDGTLPADRREAAERHLRSCPACRAEWELESRLGAAVKRSVSSAMSSFALDAESRRRILERAARGSANSPFTWNRLAAYAAAAALLAIAGWGALLGMRERPGKGGSVVRVAPGHQEVYLRTERPVRRIVVEQASPERVVVRITNRRRVDLLVSRQNGVEHGFRGSAVID